MFESNQISGSARPHQTIVGSIKKSNLDALKLNIILSLPPYTKASSSAIHYNGGLVYEMDQQAREDKQHSSHRKIFVMHMTNY